MAEYRIAAARPGKPWRRVYRAKRGGRFLWAGTPYARLLMRLGRLQTTVSDVELPAFHAWCGSKHLKADIVATVRSAMLDTMRWALAHEPEIGYDQHRPMRLEPMVDRTLPFSMDCSESYTALCEAAGAPDPNGRGYDGIGNTQTIRAHLPLLRSVAECKVGDAIVYGPADVSKQHVVAVMTPGPDPEVWSLGQPSGPRPYRHSVELAAHGGVCTAHDLGVD